MQQTKTLIQIDTDQVYIQQFFNACKSFEDKIIHKGVKDKYIDVCQFSQEFRNGIDIIVVSLEIQGTDAQIMSQHLRSAYQRAFIVGMLSRQNPYYKQIEGIALSCGMNAVMMKTTSYQQTVQEIIAKVFKPTQEAYNGNMQFDQITILEDDFTIGNNTNRQMNNNNRGGNGNNPPAIVPQMIGISGSKGGVGKTTLSTEIATALAMARNKEFGGRLRVCLADMDLDFGDVPTMLNIRSGKNIFTWVEDINIKLKTLKEEEIQYSWETIEDQFLKSEDSGLYVLLPCISPLQSALIQDHHIRIIMKHLKQYFHFVVLDLGNNTRDFTVLGIYESTDVILVADFEKTAIKSLKIMLEALKHIKFPVQNYNFVLNKVEADVGLNEKEIIETIENKLGLRYLGSLPYQKQVKKLQNESITMMEYCEKNNKDNEFSLNIKRIIGEITPIFKNGKSKPVITQKTETKTGLWGVLKRFVGIEG